LRGKGLDVTYVGYAMKGCGDLQVLDLSIKENRVLITNDLEFGAYLLKRKTP
jgi:predicted nuclease of predicted toxin-antitoxin system